MKKLLLIAIYLFVTIAFGQNRMVSGIIVDQNKDPLSGATVVIEGIKKGTQTHFDGNFSLEVEKNKNLLVSYLGFKTKKVKFKNLGNSVIELKEDVTVCFTTRDHYLPFKIHDIPLII